METSSRHLLVLLAWPSLYFEVCFLLSFHVSCSHPSPSLAAPSSSSFFALVLWGLLSYTPPQAPPMGCPLLSPHHSLWDLNLFLQLLGPAIYWFRFNPVFRFSGVSLWTSHIHHTLNHTVTWPLTIPPSPIANASCASCFLLFVGTELNKLGISG